MYRRPLSNLVKMRYKMLIFNKLLRGPKLI